MSWILYNLLSAIFAALDRLSVVFVPVFAVLFLGGGLTWKSGLGVVLITPGAIFMILK